MATNFNDSELLQKLATGYMHNLQASNNASTPNTKLDIASGECRNASDQIDMVMVGATINTANVGVLGMDTGALAASTWYAAYALKDTSNTLASTFVLSASLSAPADQSVNSVTYDAVRLVDYWVTDGSTHFLKGTTRGNGTYRTRIWQSVQPTALTTGSPGTATVATAIDLSASIPPISGCLAILEVSFAPATANDYGAITEYGSSAAVSTWQKVSGSVAGKYNTRTIEVPVVLNSGVPEVYYANSAAAGSLVVNVVGFRYQV